MKRILVSLGIIGAVAAVAIGGTLAYFRDVETSAGNTMTAGTIDLKIDFQCKYQQNCKFSLRDLNGESFFGNWYDIKPGDEREVTISWHVYENNAWAKIRLADVFEYDNGCTESETEAGDATCGDPGLGEGELDDYLTFTAWMDEGQVSGWQCPDGNNGPCDADPMEGDNILNGVETPMIKDISVNQIINQGGIKLPEELESSTTYYLGLKASILPSVGNIIQTDGLVGKIVMEVVQSQNNPQSSFVNGGFETGDFTGWTVTLPIDGDAQVVSTWTGDQGQVYNPKEGSKFALVKTDGPGSYSTVRQSVALRTGETIAGWAAFDARDYLPYNDEASVNILDSGNNVIATPWQDSVSELGDYADGPWTPWYWTAPADGTYTVELKIANSEDELGDSYALFDANVIEP